MSTARPLLTTKHYREGGQHLLPLLNLLLPGIDVNDPTKASSSLMFIAVTSQFVPFIDSSESKVPLETEAEQVCRMNTSGFEDWTLLFLSKIIALCENLPDQHSIGLGNSESSLMEIAMV